MRDALRSSPTLATPNTTTTTTTNTDRHNNSTSGQDDEHGGHFRTIRYQVAKIDFNRVAGPLVVTAWILLASIAKIGKHIALLSVRIGAHMYRMLIHRETVTVA